MNIFFWRKNKLIDSFSVMLADEFFSNLPPQQLAEFSADLKSAGNRKKAEKKMNRKMQSVVESAVSKFSEFIRSESLGVYGKARLHMQFMERLQQLGYEKELAEKINQDIMLKIPAK